MESTEGRYHHGNLRDALIDAAVRVVDRDGPDAISIRGLARDLGVSSAAPFRHFRDKDELMAAVADRAAEGLRGMLDEAIGSCSDALTQFRALTVGTVRYAAEHPALFDLIHSTRADSSRFLGDANDERRLRLSALIIEGQNAGMIPDVDPELVVLTHEALTHGLARMIVDGHPRLRALSSEDARKLALAATQLLQSGIGLS